MFAKLLKIVGLIFLLPILAVTFLIFRANMPRPPEPDYLFSVSPPDAIIPSWSADGNFLALGYSWGEINILSNVDGEFRQFRRFGGLQSRLSVLALNADGTLLATAFESGLVEIWDVTNGELLTSSTNHTPGIYNLAWSPDSLKIASSSSDNTAIWNIETEEITSVISEGMGLIWTPDSRILVGRTFSSGTLVWDASTNEQVATFYSGLGITLNPDGTQLAGINGNAFETFDLRTGQPLVQSNGGHNSGVNVLAWSPDGQKIASGGGTLGSDYSIRIWDATTGEQISRLTGHENSITRVFWQPDGVHLVGVSGADDNIRIWNTDTETLVSSVYIPEYSRGAIYLNPRGDIAAVVGTDSEVTLWSLMEQN